MKKIKKLVLTLSGGVVLVAMIVAINTPPTQAADIDFSDGITVDSILDTADISIGNGECDDGDGNCTLRAAIEEANASSDSSTIKFNIAGAGLHTIQPATALPSITNTTIIDGYTEPGATSNAAAHPLPMNGTLTVELDGSNLPIEGNSRGLYLLGNDIEVRGLIINNFGSHGIITVGDNAVVQGNYIGTDSTGLVDEGNGRDYEVSSIAQGVFASSGSDSILIGGLGAADRNIIAGNQAGDIFLGPDSGTALNHSTIQGNYIGVGADGTTPLPSGYALGLGNAILIENTHYTLIGGTDIGAGNIIGSSDEYGVAFREGVTHTTVQGNYIGTDYTGTQTMVHALGTGNAQAGIHVGIVSNAGYTLKSHDILIGGTSASARNIISGNNNDNSSYIAGVSLNDGAYNVTVQGNYIGTDSTGLVSIPNGTGILMDTSDDTNIQQSYDNTIGGNSSATRNIIAGNTGSGIYLNGPGITNNTIQGNYIGLGSDSATEVPNGEDGIRIIDGPQNNLIGGVNAGEGNTIVASAGGNSTEGAGIITYGNSSLNAFLRNSISANTGLGIDLNPTGVTSNDVGDADTGPNGLLNFPEYTQATEVSGSTEVDYVLDVPAGQYRIEFFSNVSADLSGNGEGHTFLGAHSITSAGSGNQPFSYTLTGVTGVTNLAMTATEIDDVSPTGYGATSEFGGEPLPVTDLVLTKTLTNPDDIVAGGIATYELTLTNNGYSPISLAQFDGTNPNPFTGNLIVDFMTPELQFVSSSNSDVACTDLGSAGMGSVAANHADYSLVTCSYAGLGLTLNEGESISTTITTTVANDSDLIFTNYAVGAAAADDPEESVIVDALFAAYGGGGTPDMLDALISSAPNNFASAVYPIPEEGVAITNDDNNTNLANSGRSLLLVMGVSIITITVGSLTLWRRRFMLQ